MHEHYENWLEADRRREERDREISRVSWKAVAVIVALPAVILPAIWIIARLLGSS